MSLRPRMALGALRSARAASTSASSAPAPTSSASSSSTGSSTPPPKTRSPFYLALLALPLGLGAYYYPRRKPLTPQVYSEQPVSGLSRLTPRHALLTMPVDTAERAQFGSEAVTASGAQAPDNVVVVQHVMVRNPTLMIERPYTPINDVEADGEMRMVVKRVRGGEVGRLVHSLSSGSELGVRGPIPTMALNPGAFDTIVMISTGTAVAPFLQLLAKTPAGVDTKFRLLQARADGEDWSAESIDALKHKFGDRLQVNRIAPGAVQKADVAGALRRCGKVLVMVCLPPNIMRPLCGTLTPTLEQGPLTGLLADMGLSHHQVWKLE